MGGVGGGWTGNAEADCGSAVVHGTLVENRLVWAEESVEAG